MPTVNLTKMGATIGPLEYGWRDTVKGADGKFYGIPYSSEDILIIDPLTKTASRSNMGASLTGASKWDGGVLAGNGKIYCSPWNSSDFLVIDTVNGTATRSNLGLTFTASTSWSKPALGNDGNVYAFPYSHSGVLKIDTSSDTASIESFGLVWSGLRKYFGTVRGPDGLVYGAPADRADIPRIDGIAGTCVRNSMGATLSSNALKWRGGAVSSYDNKIYFGVNSGSVPRDLDVNTVTQQATVASLPISFPGDSYFSSVLEGWQEVLYYLPHSCPYIGTQDPRTGAWTSESFGMAYDTTGGKWGAGAVDNDRTIYAVPFASEYIFVLETAPKSIRPVPRKMQFRPTTVDLKANKFPIPEPSGRTGIRLSKKNFIHEFGRVMHAGDTVNIALDWDDLLIGSQEYLLTFGAESRDLTVETITFDANNSFIRVSGATTTSRSIVTLRALTSEGRELVRDIVVRTQYEPTFPVPTPP